MTVGAKQKKQLNDKIAIRIKYLRENIEPIQSKFADDNMIDRQIVNRWESTTDKRGLSIHTINRFCNMISISLKDFFDDKLFKDI
ncbi:transcriptional regulator [Gillisia sp. Hel_I_29]|uniref:transcriptional regulator n=1 Tax=Gillisia sp. Hel_I_29 TaxID=1249975 RepID=UPI0005570694|nr:transcriptional regulator [Gillisia sp. Hel_I_29]